MRRWTWLLMFALAAPLGAGEGPRKPRLNLRASPRLAFSPVRVFTMAELVGGEPNEDYYCPAVEWDWGDGSRSAQEGDCPPFGSLADFARRYTAEHIYRRAGQFDIRLTLRRASRSIASASVSVSVRPALASN